MIDREYQGKDQWVKRAKDLAVFQAEYLIESVRGTAEIYDIDFEWFIDEVIKNMNKLKKNEG